MYCKNKFFHKVKKLNFQKTHKAMAQKSEFRKWLIENIKCKGEVKPETHAFFKVDVKQGIYAPHTSLGLLDHLIPLRGFSAYNKETMEIATADRLLEYLKEIFDFCFDTVENLIVITDKEYVPIQKGVTQQMRKEKEKVDEEFRMKMLDIIKERGFFIKLGHTLPLPWNESTGGANRSKLMRFIINTFMYDQNFFYCPPCGKVIVFDGHYLTKNEEIFKDIGNAIPNQVPVALVHPSHGKEKTYKKDQQQIIVDGIVYDLGEENVHNVAGMKQRPNVNPYIEFKNDMGEFDLAFVRHIVVAMKEFGTTSFTIYSADSDIVLICLWFLYRLRNAIGSFNIEEDYEKIEGESNSALKKRIEQQIKNFTTAAKNIQMYINYGAKTRDDYCNVNVLYKKLVKRFLNNDEDLIPTFLCVVVSKSSDYTFGFMGVSMKTFINSYLENIKYIRPIIKFDGDDYTHLLIDSYAYKRMLIVAYLAQYSKNQNVKKLLQEKKLKELDLNDVRIAVKKAVITKKNKSLLESVDSYKQFKKRRVSNEIDSDIESDDNELTDKSIKIELFEASPDDFKKAMKAFAKQVPPDSEIKHRFDLVHGYMFFIHMYGNKFVKYPNAERFGFTSSNGNMLTAANIKMLASNDWEKLEEKRKKYILQRSDLNATYRTITNTVVSLTTDSINENGKRQRNIVLDDDEE